MNVHTIMSAKVLSVRPGSTVMEIWKQLFERRVNAIPVVDANKKLLGIITKEDLLKTLYPDYQEYFQAVASTSDFEEMETKVRDIRKKKAKDIMCTRVIFTRGDAPIMRALS